MIINWNVFYLVIWLASMYTTIKCARWVQSVLIVKKLTQVITNSAQIQSKYVIQAVDNMIWKRLATPFSHRKGPKKRWSGTQHSQSYKGYENKNRIRLPSLWQSSKRIKLKQKRPRRKYLFQHFAPKRRRCNQGSKSILAMSSDMSKAEEAKVLSWDSDSFVIGIDQHTSAPISNDKRHFIELDESTAKVVGVDEYQGVLQWARASWYGL